mgnify:CR=1 FL=1|tara:strand:- start:97 stop:291 length:195 start_codon:yes stop_codon:yes gene_type:complete
MIKVGDRVSLFDNIGREGVVSGMERQKSNQWMVGATMEHIFIITIQFDDGKLERHRADKVMRLE